MQTVTVKKKKCIIVDEVKASNSINTAEKKVHTTLSIKLGEELRIFEDDLTVSVMKLLGTFQ